MNSFKKKFKKNIFLENLILVTGTHTSGKSMVSPIIASLQNVEMLRKIYYLDQLAVLNYFKNISLETSKFIANHILDLSYYEQLIGRNMNFRFEDETSVATSKDPDFFKKRLKIKRGPSVIKSHKRKKTSMLLDTHDGVWFYKFWLSLGIKNLKIINISRNPIDIINSWFNADLGEAEKQLLCQIPLIQHGKKIKPFYFFKQIKDNNLKLNKYEVVIDMVQTCVEYELKHFNLIKNKKNILRIDFDQFASKTELYLSKIIKFLKKKRTKFTKKILIRERLPRVILSNEREIKLKKIKNKVSAKYLKRIIDLEKKYLKSINKI